MLDSSGAAKTLNANDSDRISALSALTPHHRTNSQSPHLSSPMKQPTASSYLSNTKSNYKSSDKMGNSGSAPKSATRRLQSQS